MLGKPREKKREGVLMISKSGPFYHNIAKISRCITLNQSKATFGFNDR